MSKPGCQMEINDQSSHYCAVMSTFIMSDQWPHWTSKHKPWGWPINRDCY